MPAPFSSHFGHVCEHGEELARIAFHLDDCDNGLRIRFGSRYEWFLEQGRTAIVMTMAARDIPSPFLAAVHLGVRGELSGMIGSDDDAFSVLIHAALQIWSGKSVSGTFG